VPFPIFKKLINASLLTHLVRAGSDGHRIGRFVIPEPAPAAALHTHRGRREGGLHLVEGPELGFDQLGELTVWLSATALGGRRQVLPACV